MTADAWRTQVRRAFAEHGGNLGADGSVSYLFNTVGLMTYPPGTDEEAADARGTRGRRRGCGAQR